MFRVSKKAATVQVRLTAPALGRGRMPSPELHAHRDGVDRVLADAARLAYSPEAADCRAAAEVVAAAVAVVVEELTGQDLAPQHARMANLAAVGWSVAAIEDLSSGSAVGLTLAHVDTVLLFLALENHADDELVKAVSDWALEAGYYLRRTGRRVPDLLPSLCRDLIMLFPVRMLADDLVEGEAAQPVPAPRAGADRAASAQSAIAS